MSKLNFLLACLVAAQTSFAQSFSLDVSGGFGSGLFQTGDSARVFSKKYPPNSVFWGWSGDVSPLENPTGWNSLLVMPAQNVQVSANFKSLPPNPNPILEKIMGRDTLKRVYRWFPAGGGWPKGVVWLFHGTGGSANGWINSFENRDFLNTCMADGFAVVVTECEETTKGADLNNDGKIRWSPFPVDSVANVDYANIRAIRDTFVHRGWMSAATPQFAVGMSNGGSFSVTFGAAMRWKGVVSYCAPGANIIANTTLTPTMWCMAKYDNNENVGPQGNADALAQHQIMLGRGICTRYFLHDRAPVFAERFERRGDISTAQALAVFQDLQANNCLDPESFLNISGDSIGQLVIASPLNWPGIAALTSLQRGFVREQLSVSFADHQFFGDFNGRTLDFLNHACTASVGLPGEPGIFSTTGFHVSPNPASGFLNIEKIVARPVLFHLSNVSGKIVRTVLAQSEHSQIPVIDLPSGIYFLSMRLENGQSGGVQKVVLEH